MLNRTFAYTDTTRQPMATATRRAPYLVIEDVSKVYPTPKGPYTVLKDVNLTVSEGEFIYVIGHSGCGKSTLLNMVAGFNTPTTGKVELGSKPITKPGPDRMVVFQNYALLPWRTAFENIYIENSDRAGTSGTGGTNGRCRQKAAATLRWNETAGFNRASLGDSSQGLDSG